MTADATPSTSPEPSANGNGHRRITKAELDRLRGNVGKTRPKGTLPFLRRDETEVEYFRQWLTLAFKPQDGFEFETLERSTRPVDPCTLIFRRGTEHRRFDFDHLADLVGPRLRTSVYTAAGGFLRMPRLSPPEREDVGDALCLASNAEDSYNERDETRKWIERLLEHTSPMTVPTLDEMPGKLDALLTVLRSGEFGQGDALILAGRGRAEEFPRRPVRIIDQQTGTQWLRSRETWWYVRVVHDARLDLAGLSHRLNRIGVQRRRVDARSRTDRTLHPQLVLYQLTAELIALADEAPAPINATGQTPRNDKGEEMMF